ncbi:MAG: lipoprotein signal peptidase [Bacteroidales bacterium]|nr:lipoprotein signal peptidase [Bacteroidales bacterium]
MSLFKKSLLLVFILLVIDQTIKVWIKLNYNLGENDSILEVVFGIQGGEWARIHFTENKGAAFGMLIGGDTGKLVLSLFRLLAITALIWYLYKISKQKLPKVARFGVALILTGAIGNMIDSAFYGLIFSSSKDAVATLFPEGGGYAGFLYGSVVDMFYFPMFNGTAPTWFPEWSWWPWPPESNISFFPYIFNFADSAVTVGVVIIILFRKKFVVHEEIIK